jgi:HD superfamily phosphohydrolase YqeK
LRQEQLRDFKAWSQGYVKGFYSDDPEIQAAVKLKEEHTARVQENIVRIARSLGVEGDDLLLAESIALFHDIGRFRQFAVYRTFNDRHSVNHALLGLRELETAGVLSGLPGEERSLVLTAIEYHNICELPPAVPDRLLLFAGLIRDADKLDILRLFAEDCARGEEQPDPLLGPDLPDTPGYSPALVERLLQHQLCSYADLQNFNDRKLLYLSWLYDINFAYTLSEIAGNGYIEVIVTDLPATGEIRAVHEHLQDYVNRRLAPPV